VLMNVPFTAMHFSVYEAAKKWLLHVDDGDEEAEDRLSVQLVAGVLRAMWPCCKFVNACASCCSSDLWAPDAHQSLFCTATRAPLLAMGAGASAGFGYGFGYQPLPSPFICTWTTAMRRQKTGSACSWWQVCAVCCVWCALCGVCCDPAVCRIAVPAAVHRISVQP
jgi:hypothetical protein